jgi:hypothetical protein
LKQKRIFFLAGILTNLRRCHLQTKNLGKLIFVNKNWLNDFRIGCKSPSNLMESFERDIDSKEEKENFESDFERDEVVEV